MKRLFMLLMCFLAVMMASLSAKAQDITITLLPGWTWISYPKAEAMDIPTALGDFVPMEGDIIKSQFSSTSYINGQWRGRLMQFTPGMGYHYYSMRGEPTTLVFASSTPQSQVQVTTSEPMLITAVSAMGGGEVTTTDGTYIIVKGLCWARHENPTTNEDYYEEAESGVGTFSVSMTGLNISTTYYVRAYAVTPNGTVYGDQKTFTTEASGDHAYVDLGLPSGTMWATCNVGADNPEDYGDYFAWGETQPKDTYNWSTYQYCMGNSNTLTKYCTNASYGYNGFTDNLTTLLPEDDAATANWGSDWRMPTREDYNELYDNTTQTWTTQNGVNGQLFTATNGNSLFLPAAGDRYFEEGSKVYYWSSSLDLACGGPWAAYYNSYYSEGWYSSYFPSRYYGRSVRPVRVGSQNTAPTGAINGKFTINSNGDQVYFSQGNLQYQASTNTWKFADNQYDYIGSANRNISSSYSGWIDLFSWGTSGYSHGAACYQPWSTCNDEDYWAYGNWHFNLFDQTGQADWGYNPISNGGNQENLWRTLTSDEWTYLFNTRNTISGIRYANAIVLDIKGVILLPDDWDPLYYPLSNTNNSGASFSCNAITALQWSSLEQHGAIFLPAAGYRSGTDVDEVGESGSYWSASSYYDDDFTAYAIFFGEAAHCDARGYGFSVRLVRNAE